VLRPVRSFLRADGRAADLGGPALATVGRTVIALAVVGNNVVGAIAVLVLTLLVIPLPDAGDVARSGYVVAALVYVLVAVGFGVVVGVRGQRPLRRWLASDAPSDPAIRAEVLQAPLRLFWLQLWLWLGAALAFGLFEARNNGERAAWVGVIVALNGLTTASLSYLAVERLLRPTAVRAMVGADPSELGQGRGVALRAVLAWAMGCGIPVAGLLALGVRTLLPSDVTLEELSVAAVVLAGTGLLVGFWSVVLAARATAAPIAGVVDAMARVHVGDYGTRVPVYDGTEIGRLQLGFNEMVAGLAERERIRAAFGIYVDPAIAEHVLREGTDLAGEEVELSMLFVDIRDFTGFAAQTPASKVIGTINRMFEVTVPVVHDHGGHVDKFIGDGLLAVFGAPQRLPNHAAASVSAARAIAAAVDDEFRGDLSVGIGINTGTVVAGNVGGAGRFEFSVIGDPVNVAARIEAATRQTDDAILISGRTLELLDDPSIRVEERPDVVLKGKSGAVSLFAVQPE
jgi:adenylate cyclase